MVGNYHKEKKLWWKKV